ncbi:DUF368 domain-containing protein [Candidatus Methanomassiliicoccus intestinalis]|jgi:hypothetical protein|uniref:DUF368 domain-containing protein n=3 Tax=Candidatus Methanomassiliicoccus intestinalis TaxID=1406512 RepID=A0A8J8TDZ0_9ARCH|nr:DUF368 domain-containing protein [Candidatus Methanomassiliicoccus intestinalis]AGN25702.1 putative membrane protein [Candidatus Methanomassiliicoccus intestinalis Issoire-Mx1]TQS82788.1 MAG: DUF368 domain-containing protein [Candidatus Methanomassiliicoccus intestinalis]TQS84052.1 MAG: DUF368 domain-containing protein [Candidatus Methanomassiliicoccus intestinalis]
MIINFVRGFCMAIADSVPGVSGGTIAFLLGFYDKFIGAFNNILSGNKEQRINAAKFLLKLGAGWIIGFIVCVLILSSIFQSNIYQISSLFLGLIIFAIPVIIMAEKECLKGKYANLIFTIIGIVIVCLITYYNPVSGEGSSINLTQPSIELALYVFVAAIITISAMVLPGISGSTLLLAMGLYLPLLNAVKEVIHLDSSYLLMLCIFALGLIVGIFSVIKIVKHCLDAYRSQTIYLILGLMIGSIYSIIMGATTLEVPQPAMSLSTFHILFFILGGLVLVALEFMKKKMTDDRFV